MSDGNFDDSAGEPLDEIGDDARPWNIYFLSLVDPADPTRDFERVKVGYTKDDVETRIEQLQTGNPYQLRCEESFAAPAPVARLVEHWVLRTNAVRVAQREWLRLGRHEIPALAESARRERQRFADIVESRARWSQTLSDGKERQPGTDELRLHKEARYVAEDLCRVRLRLRHVEASIALSAGRILRVPGILRVTVRPPKIRFNPQEAIKRFWDLAAGCGAAEEVRGTFRWRGVPTLGSAEWSEVLSEVWLLEQRQKVFDGELIERPDELKEVGERTERLAHLHDEYLRLTQECERLRADDGVLKAQLIRCMEDAAAIGGVCSFRRSWKKVLDAKAKRSFCMRHPIEAAQCVSHVVAAVHRRICQSRSY